MLSKKLVILMLVVLAVFITLSLHFTKPNSKLPKSYCDKLYYSTDMKLREAYFKGEFPYNEVTDQLVKEAKQDKRYLNILLNYQKYPDNLLTKLSRNKEAIEYVYYYPTRDKNKDKLPNSPTSIDGITYFRQYDKRWGYKEYGDEIIGINGCGPTSLAMVVNSLTKQKVDPYEVSKMSNESGYYVNGIGSSWDLMNEGAKHYDLKVEKIPVNEKMMIDALENHDLLILSLAPGDFTRTGHFVVVRKYDNKKKLFYVNDPDSLKRSKKGWSYERLAPQINAIWCFSK